MCSVRPRYSVRTVHGGRVRVRGTYSTGHRTLSAHPPVEAVSSETVERTCPLPRQSRERDAPGWRHRRRCARRSRAHRRRVRERRGASRPRRERQLRRLRRPRRSHRPRRRLRQCQRWRRQLRQCARMLVASLQVSSFAIASEAAGSTTCARRRRVARCSRPSAQIACNLCGR